MVKRRNIAAILILLGIMGCGAKHDNDALAKVNAVLAESNAAMAQFASAADNSADRLAIIAAIRAYEENLDRLLPKADAVKAVMNRIDAAHPPEEIAATIKKSRQLAEGFLKSYAKVIQYSKDPEVNAALISMMKKNNAMPAVRVW